MRKLLTRIDHANISHIKLAGDPMKRLGLIAAFVALLSFGGARAQFVTLGNQGVVASGGGGSIAWNIGNAQSAVVAGGATQTFNGVITGGGSTIPSGANACFAFLATEGATNLAPLTITVGGQSVSTSSPVETDDSDGIFLFCAVMPAAEPDTIVISGANNFGPELVAGGFFTGFTSATATAVGCAPSGFSGSTQTLLATSPTCTGAPTTITVPASGIGITAIASSVGTAGTSCGTITWSTTGTSNITNAAGDENVCDDTVPFNLSLAHTVTAGAWGPSATSSPAFSFNSSQVAATFH
jgi:hypothetical protein